MVCLSAPMCRILLSLIVVCTLLCSVAFAQSSGPPANYTIGCFATVSTYGGVPFDFHNPQPISTFNCPSTGCDPDARTAAFLYQIDQINSAKQLLPHTKLIAECVDDQGDSSRAFFAAIELLNKGVNAVIGTYFSRVAINAALVLKGQNVPLLSWGASNPQLSNKKLYSNFGRVCQSDAGQAEAMAFVAAKRFNWQSIAIIYTADGYGQGGAEAFVQEYLNYNYTVVSDQSIIVGASVADVEIPLQRIKSIGVQTIVYFGHPEEFVSILARGTQSDLDLFSNNTAWMLCDDTVLYSASQEWKNAVADGTLNGVLGFAADDGRSTQVYQNWANAYIKRNTTGMNPLITVNPKSIADINVFDSFAADAANVAAQTLKQLFDKGNYAPTPTDWLNEIQAINMQGITGGISFDSNFERIGIKYTLKNMKGGGWVDVGTYVGHTLNLFGLLTFHDGTENPPTSFPLPAPPTPPATSIIAHSTNNAILAITIVVLIITTAYALVLIAGRDLKVFQNASVTMMAILLLGGALVCISVLIALQTQTRESCTASQWLFNLGFMLTIGSILLKTYRVHVIFNSYKLQVTAMTDHRLMFVIACMILFDSVILILRSTISPYEINDQIVCTFKDGYQTDAATALSLILVITKALMLLYTAYLTYRVRNLPSRFNESSYLSVCVYNAALLCLIWIVIRYAVNTDSHPDTINVFECALKLIGTALILTLIFLPKCITALMPLIGRKTAGVRSNNKNSGSNMSGVSMLTLSDTNGTKKAGKEGAGGEGDNRRTKAELEALIDNTIVAQTELLERSYTQLDSLHSAISDKKNLIQNTIDLLNQLDDESKFFRECVAKNYSDAQIVQIFEGRLKDIIIPQPEGMLSGGIGMSNLARSGSVLNQPRSGALGSARSNASGAGSAVSRGSVVGPKPMPKVASPRNNNATPMTFGEGAASTQLNPTVAPSPAGSHSNSTVARPGLGRQNSASSVMNVSEGANNSAVDAANQIAVGIAPIITVPTETTAPVAASTPIVASTPTSPRRARIRIHMSDNAADASTFSAVLHSTPSLAAPSAVSSTAVTTNNGGEASPN